MPRSAFVAGQPVTLAQMAAVPPISPSQELKRRILVTILVVAFYYYPNLVTDALSFFACYTVDSVGPAVNLSYLQNARVRCSCELQAR